MARTYQKTNPSNARVKIDYNNKEKPVELEYVVKHNAFKICMGVLLKPWYYFNLFSIVFTYVLVNFSNLQNRSTPYVITNSELIVVSYMLGMFIYFIGGLMLISWIVSNNEKLLKRMPDWSYKFASRKPHVADFLPEHVKDNTVEIPLFYNVGLDYKATKQFSKYLDRVVIKEHEFNKLLKSGKNKGKKKPNEYLWKATFYFSQKPENGTLRVSFK